jgi:hypothetical protein
MVKARGGREAHATHVGYLNDSGRNFLRLHQEKGPRLFGRGPRNSTL